MLLDNFKMAIKLKRKRQQKDEKKERLFKVESASEIQRFKESSSVVGDIK